ncbi:MAG: hypothetical protein ACFFDD_13220 [Promethearchaeota archaeon]
MRVFKVIREFLEGVWESQKASLADPLMKAKMHEDDSIMFIVFGELLGYQFQSSFYSRLLFVHYIEKMMHWQKRLLKEQDVLDKMYE